MNESKLSRNAGIEVGYYVVGGPRGRKHIMYLIYLLFKRQYPVSVVGKSKLSRVKKNGFV